jgi:hypothetical protein
LDKQENEDTINLLIPLHVCYSKRMPLSSKDEHTVRTIVQEELLPLDHKVEQIITSAIEASEVRLDKKYNRVINTLDKVAGELQGIREELVMVSGHKDQLENHEERITTLELAASANVQC